MKKTLLYGALFLACCGTASAQIRAARLPQLIVRLQSSSVNAALVARANRVTLTDKTTDGPFALMSLASKEDIHAAQARLQADPRVLWAEDNVSIGTPEGQSAIKGSTMPVVGDRSQLYSLNTGWLNQINWSSSLSTSTGRTVKLAILDTGLSVLQGYLWEKTSASANFIEKGIPDDRPMHTNSNGNGDYDEGAGHGTMVAGIADQVAPNVKFVIARVADSDGTATAWTLTKGLSFAVAQGAEVANVSLGSPNQVPAISDVMDYCEENRLLVVAAIGNSNTGDAYYPARITKVLCVSGLLPDNRKAPFSNWDGHCDSAAPATGIISQYWDGHFGTWSGTSFASPMVAAAVADCLRRTTPKTPDFLSDAVSDSGVDIDDLNPNYRRDLGTLLDIQNLNSAIAN